MRFHFPDYNPTGSYAAEGQTHPLSAAHRALAECQKAGTIAEHVNFKTCDIRGRRGPGIALEIQLEATRRDRGRRAGNTGRYGARTGYGGDGLYAATYDEWGFFIAALYRLARETKRNTAVVRRNDGSLVGMVDTDRLVGPGEFFCGSAKYKVYGDANHFHYLTGRTYDPTYPELLERWEAITDEPDRNYGKIDVFRYRSGRNQIGRRGAGRVHVENNGTRWAKLDIRSPEWLRRFQNGEVF